MDPGEIILWAAVLGLLIGIIWSLRYVVKLERRMVEMDNKLSSLLRAKTQKTASKTAPKAAPKASKVSKKGKK